MKAILEEVIHTLGDLNRELRLGLNCTYEEYSKIVGLGARTISRLETYHYIDLYNYMQIHASCMICFTAKELNPVLKAALISHCANTTHLTPEEFANLRVVDAIDSLIQALHEDYERKGVISKASKEMAKNVSKKIKKVRNPNTRNR